MYKRMLLHCTVLILLLLLTSCGMMDMLGDHSSSEEGSGGLALIEEECRMLNYTIDGDIVRFRYAFRFTNHSDTETKVGDLNTDFEQEDMVGWLKPRILRVGNHDMQRFFGEYENGEEYQVILPGETKDIVMIYTGVYLGGEVNMNLRRSGLLSFTYR